MNHEWVRSTLGHGEQMCSRCGITNREAAVLNKLNWCGKLEEWAEWKGEGPAPKKWYAINPKTDEAVLVYRSYEDYCDD